MFLQCSDTQNELFEKYKAQAIDMEGAAVAQVAEQFGVPSVVVRCMSDMAGVGSQKLSSKISEQGCKTIF